MRERILLGDSDAKIDSDDLCHLLRRLDFSERISGRHHIFRQRGVEEMINLPPRGGTAKNTKLRKFAA